jgi:mannosidase alpha-like ER degradation enhancer 2
MRHNFSNVSAVINSCSQFHRKLTFLRIPISSAACAGTLLLEFGTLSRLSGNPIYERVAKRALLALWSRRSELGLVGGHIDVKTGEWTHKDSGVGTSVDSYYEYLIKGHLMTGEYEYLVMFQQGAHSQKS